MGCGPPESCRHAIGPGSIVAGLTSAARVREVVSPEPRTVRLATFRPLCRWWEEQGSNLRRLSHLIYSQAPLAAWVSSRAPVAGDGA